MVLVPRSELDARLCLSVHLSPHAGGRQRGQRALCVSQPTAITSCLSLSVYHFHPLSTYFDLTHVFFLLVFSTCAGVLTLFTSACYLWSARRRAPLHLGDKQQFYAQVGLCVYMCMRYLKCVLTTALVKHLILIGHCSSVTGHLCLFNGSKSKLYNSDIKSNIPILTSRCFLDDTKTSSGPTRWSSKNCERILKLSQTFKLLKSPKRNR